MLTYEKVLSVFEAYLQTDDAYDVVMTKHGYTVLNGDAGRRELYEALLCRTPEELRDTLLDAYRDYNEFLMVERSGDTERDVTPEEEKKLDKLCAAMRAKCQ